MKKNTYQVVFGKDAELPIINGKTITLPEGVARRLHRMPPNNRDAFGLRKAAVAEFCPSAPLLPKEAKVDVRYYRTTSASEQAQHVFGILHQRQTLIDDLGMQMDIEPSGVKQETEKNHEGKSQTYISDTFKIVLTNTKTGRNMDVPFSMRTGNRTTYDKLHPMSRGVTIGDVEMAESTACVSSPLPLDILDCLMSDDFQDMLFEDWCDEYGYDTDSRKAFQIYETCREQTLKFKSVFPRVDLSEYIPLRLHRGEEIDREELSPQERWTGYLEYLKSWSAPLVTPVDYDEWFAGNDDGHEVGKIPSSAEEETLAAAYIEYLSEWANNHADLDFMGSSPAGFGEWLESEWAEQQSQRPAP